MPQHKLTRTRRAPRNAGGDVTAIARIRYDTSIAPRMFAKSGQLWRDLTQRLREHLCSPVKIQALHPVTSPHRSRPRTLLLIVDYRIYAAWEVDGKKKAAMEALILNILVPYLGITAEFERFDLLIDEYVDA